MYKTKALLGLAVTIGTLALTATPSLAWFKSLSGRSENQAKAIATAVLEGGGGTIECPVKGSEIHYKIQKKIGRSIFEQKAATEGPDQIIRIANWGTECTSTFGAIKAAAEVKPCEIHIQQQSKGQTTATGSVLTECIIKTSICEIKIPVANETTGENNNLPGGNLIQKGNDVFAEAESKGDVTGVGNGGFCPYVSNKTSTFKTKILELEEQII